MRKSLIAIGLLVALLTGSMAASAAPLSGMLVGGVRTHGTDLDPYLYAEGAIRENLSLGLEYYHRMIHLSAWFGADGGLYSEVTWDGGVNLSPVSAELGLWREAILSDSVVAYGWFGAKRQLVGTPATWLTINGEAQVALNGPFRAIIGATAEFAEGARSLNGWVGIGYSF